jgi:hypothetical protein
MLDWLAALTHAHGPLHAENLCTAPSGVYALREPYSDQLALAVDTRHTPSPPPPPGRRCCRGGCVASAADRATTTVRSMRRVHHHPAQPRPAPLPQASDSRLPRVLRGYHWAAAPFIAWLPPPSGAWLPPIRPPAAAAPAAADPAAAQLLGSRHVAPGRQQLRSEKPIDRTRTRVKELARTTSRSQLDHNEPQISFDKWGGT